MKTKIFAMAIAALALAACDKNNDDFTVDNLKDTPITIASAGVEELTTRAIADGKLVGTADENATMSIFITGGSEAKYNATNVKWEHDRTGWDSETSVLYEGTNSSQKIYACSPFDANAASGSVTVTASEQTDWLVATEKRVTSNSMALTMTHALTKLVLEPTYGTELTDPTISSVEVGGMYASGTLKISDNTWSNCGTANATLPMANKEVLVIPMEECESFPITITMADSRTFKTTISLTSVDNMLEAGIQYNIALQVGQDKVTLGGITASSWGTPVDGGELETE